MTKEGKILFRKPEGIREWHAALKVRDLLRRKKELVRKKLRIGWGNTYRKEENIFHRLFSLLFCVARQQTKAAKKVYVDLTLKANLF